MFQYFFWSFLLLSRPTSGRSPWQFLILEVFIRFIPLRKKRWKVFEEERRTHNSIARRGEAFLSRLACIDFFYHRRPHRIFRALPPYIHIYIYFFGLRVQGIEITIFLWNINLPHIFTTIFCEILIYPTFQSRFFLWNINLPHIFNRDFCETLIYPTLSITIFAKY